MSKKRGTCPKCNREDMAIMARGMCATCYMKLLQKEKQALQDSGQDSTAPGNPPAGLPAPVPMLPASDGKPGPLIELATELVSIVEKTIKLAEDSIAAGNKIADSIKPLRLRYIELRDQHSKLTIKAKEVTVTILDDDANED